MKQFLHFIQEEDTNERSTGLEHDRVIGKTHPGLSHLKYKIKKDEEHEGRWHLEDETGKIVASVSGQNHSGAMAALKNEGYDV